jgi:hypothetical protein
MCHDQGVQVLLVTVGEGDDDGGSTAARMAAAWTEAAPRCVVERIALPASSRGTPPSEPAGATAGSGRGGVFVPTAALGLRSVEAPDVAPHLVQLGERAARVDVVVVHCPVLEAATLHEGAVADAARAAAPHAVPVVVLAGVDRTSRRELAAAGVAAVHVVGDPWEPARVARTARTWAPAWTTGPP